ncbi:MAG: phosphatidate cytidylyltransferase [bacterium]|nr:phosphatidate cytidylyltransferase [bacterium]MDT8366597.1 phosphatidate cytidylyltransferase [bacterium]
MIRIVPAVVLGALVIYLITAAPLILGVLAISIAVLAAAHETAALLEAAGSTVARVPAVTASFLLLAGAWGGGVQGLATGLAAGFTLTFAWVVLIGKVEGSALQLSGGTLLLFYPVWSLAHLILYLDSGSGRRALLFLLLCVWVCDSAAYYVGSTLGRRKLAPEISPNKTVAGAVGGTLGAAGVSVLLKMLSLVPWSIPFALSAGLCIAVLAQMGDLAESMLKRDAGVKDSGSLIPGHGGMMDRVDALLFTVPVFYYILSLSGGLV